MNDKSNTAPFGDSASPASHTCPECGYEIVRMMVEPETLGPDISRMEGEGGLVPPMPDVEPEPFPGYRDGDASARPDAPVNAHRFDYLVFVDGAYRYTVPCGVCGTNDPGDPDHAERVRLHAGYGVKSPALRETVRRHMEAALATAHPGATVEVR